MSEAPERIEIESECGHVNTYNSEDRRTWLHFPDNAPDYFCAKYVRADRIEELEAKLAKAVEALGRVMVGGNHLATILPDSLPPAETEPRSALEIMGYGYDFEVWCCWRSIMLARTTLAELTGGKNE